MTRAIVKQRFNVGHITFEMSHDPHRGNCTFKLLAGAAPKGGTKPLFTGVIEQGMGDQLRDLSLYCSALEDMKR